MFDMQAEVTSLKWLTGDSCTPGLYSPLYDFCMIFELVVFCLCDDIVLKHLSLLRILFGFVRVLNGLWSVSYFLIAPGTSRIDFFCLRSR